ncbi:MAG: hypothetical protein F4Y00_09010 [Bacteroidetes bacterium SB0662_bin_6]|nr:hypothetical protein [Bacteroidetes bacterium SB0668_bin_1]MYE05092.1 hypothetical protein [Bacteroidetes bacterium SB0662_bin_6]
MSTCSTRSTRVFPALIAVCLATGCLASAACAQETQEPFSRIALRGGMTPAVRHNASYSHWQHGSGGIFTAATPFYFGEAEAGVALHRYSAVRRDTPSFNAFFTFVGWGTEYTVPRVFSWHAGMRTGIYHMIFDEEPGDEEEKEFSLALVSRIDLHLSETLRLFVEGHVMRTYTLPRLDTAGLTGGIGLRFRNPDWLRTLLK